MVYCHQFLSANSAIIIIQIIMIIINTVTIIKKYMNRDSGWTLGKFETESVSLSANVRR
jgi:hypothetical protein